MVIAAPFAGWSRRQLKRAVPRDVRQQLIESWHPGQTQKWPALHAAAGIDLNRAIVVRPVPKDDERIVQTIHYQIAPARVPRELSHLQLPRQIHCDHAEILSPL
jgi:hypothetical protein